MTTSQRPLLSLARSVLSLRAETDYDATRSRIHADANLTSGNVWALVFAILIASVGLNVNSTAVIIGAMLISPLMGPIVGLGLALGTDDLTLFRRSIRNLLIATGVALLASTAYFLISPLADAQSELLARTRPTLYDVLIALFGGSAGIVASSRKGGGGNVVPGVAIATALMPPLCTAGFGLAHGDAWFFLGAMHLYLINALFICLATLVFVRIMGFDRVAIEERAAGRRVHAAVAILTFVLVLPSVYTGYYVVRETRFRQAARRFIDENLRIGDRTLLNADVRYGRDSSVITATILGVQMPASQVDALRARFADYGLARTRLVVSQPLEQPATLDALREQVRRSLATDFASRTPVAAAGTDAQRQRLEAEVLQLRADVPPTRAVLAELAAMEPSLLALSMGRQLSRTDSASGSPTRWAALVAWRELPPESTRDRIERFLRVRLGGDSLTVAHIRQR